MALHIVHHGGYDAEFPAGHRFPMSKYRRLMEVLRDRKLVSERHLHTPEPAPARWLCLAHDATYVDQVIAAAVPHLIAREIGFEIDTRVSMRARLASAGSVLAARLALDHGIACNAAGGSHHARREQGAGFCTFNDVGVAANVLLAEAAVSRVLVIDLDVHQGDGTARIFAGDDRVFTFSMHAEKNYPVRKALSDRDVGLPDGLADDAYLGILNDELRTLFDRARPDLVFYNAGVDPHAEDRLGRLALTDNGLRARDSLVIGACRLRGIPVCGVIGGGYSRDIDALAARHAILFEEAAKAA
ncbi:MAG: histone deacetylase [Rhizobiaceae bacterium]|nr:histone deacetylase [Rhizobiaceae bacterium]